MDRSSGGLERGSSCGTGRGIDSVHTVNAQQDRQEEVWSVPTNTERREIQKDASHQESLLLLFLWKPDHLLIGAV